MLLRHVILAHPTSQIFQVDILRPVGGPGLLEWYVNDVQDGSAVFLRLRTDQPANADD
jgi:hypothetical protein